MRTLTGLLQPQYASGQSGNDTDRGRDVLPDCYLRGKQRRLSAGETVATAVVIYTREVFSPGAAELFTLRGYVTGKST